jgi:hypothetical protein
VLLLVRSLQYLADDNAGGARLSDDSMLLFFAAPSTLDMTRGLLTAFDTAAPMETLIVGKPHALASSWLRGGTTLAAKDAPTAGRCGTVRAAANHLVHAGEFPAYPAVAVRAMLPKLRHVVVVLDLCDSAQVPPAELFLRSLADALRAGAATQAAVLFLGLVDPDRSHEMEVSIADLEELLLPVRAAAPIHAAIQIVKYA